MKKLKLDMPVVISSLQAHYDIKKTCLKYINDQKSERIFSENHNDLNITRCDWTVKGVERKWLEVLRPHLLSDMERIYKDLGYQKFDIQNIWFQQYAEGGIHGWHVHTQCQWTNVYYLDLPEECPQTELINPYDQKTIIKLDVKEGDLLTFPSFVIHRAPKNITNKTKTIISFNSDSDIGSEAYEV